MLGDARVSDDSRSTYGYPRTLIEFGIPVAELYREHGMSAAFFYTWCAKSGGRDASLMKRMKDPEAENQRLKKTYAESKMDADILKDALAGKY